jgi:spore maturation protein SpmA
MRGLSAWKKSPPTASITKDSEILFLALNASIVCFIATDTIQGRNDAWWLSCIPFLGIATTSSVTHVVLSVSLFCRNTYQYSSKEEIYWPIPSCATRV